MAARMVVRELRAQGPAELANDNASRRSLGASRLSGTGDGFKTTANPQIQTIAGSPQAGIPTIQYPHCMPERRRIVAQVRREARKNRGFLAAENKAARCDDLLTSTVDNDDRAGL